MEKNVTSKRLWESVQEMDAENEPSSISDILLLLRGGATAWLGSVFWGRACGSSRLLYTTLLALLGNNVPHRPPQPTPTSDTSVPSQVLLRSHCSTLFLHLSRLSVQYCSLKWHCRPAVCPAVLIFFLPKKANAHYNESLVWIEGF